LNSKHDEAQVVLSQKQDLISHEKLLKKEQLLKHEELKKEHLYNSQKLISLLSKHDETQDVLQQ